MFAFRREHRDTTWRGGKNVSVNVHLEPVARPRKTPLQQGDGIKEQAARAKQAVGLHVECHDSGQGSVTYRDIESFFVRTKCEDVWEGKILREQGDRSIRGNTVDAVPRNFLQRGSIASLKAVRRIGKINGARTVKDKIV